MAMRVYTSYAATIAVISSLPERWKPSAAAHDTGMTPAEGWPVQAQSSQSRASASVLLVNTALLMLTLPPSTQSVASGSPTPQDFPMAIASLESFIPLVPSATPIVCIARCLARSRTSSGMSSYFRFAVNSASVCV